MHRRRHVQAWARLRLTGTSQPGEERVADALAAVAVWHPAVRRPPQIVRIAGAPPAATVSRAAHALDVVLGVLDEADARAITVTAAGGSAELRVRVACRLADPPSPGVVGDLRKALEHRVHRVDVHDDGDGVQVVIAVRADGQVAHRVPVAVAA